MGKPSFLDKISGKKTSQAPVSKSPKPVDADNQEEVGGSVDHLWMKEDIDAEQPKAEKNPKIDTVILRNRIADKIAKMDKN